MLTKNLLAMAAAGLLGEALGLAQHGHQHQHEKKDLVTEVVTVTDWVTVTVPQVFVANTHIHKTRSRKASSSAAAPPPAPTAPSAAPAPAPTTLFTAQKVSSSAAAPAPPASVPKVETPVAAPPAPTTQAPAAPSAPAAAKPTTAAAKPVVDTPKPSSGQTGTAQRGLAYNFARYLPSFVGSGTKIHWTYNWGQLDDSGIATEFVPMLWGLSKGFPATWAANAQKGIDSGSKALLSFNECDNDGQANLSPAAAAAGHISLMNPFSGKARISTPAITNSVSPNQGISWLKQWFSACGGKCAVDFVACHIYGVDTNVFLQHLINVHDAFGLPVWLTEFAFSGTPESINQQLATVIHQLETNATFSFVERYSYFMVAEGLLISQDNINALGHTFAYGP
ncbi:glycosyl hydrolase catalytic core-domain-containing protein [Cercophora scortea]|uniref:Glycosyl hydrolase catalytic core-domain-containing protein n=1 Tax=Cercophora scortea TaxID=314031 RepID=A0AAE0M768_9PEZI|nr:glycosyl hydrolase catalytic core-domain-containing protein [Cercophora scortea]